jgi:ABC-2 type transport system permease protein
MIHPALLAKEIRENRVKLIIFLVLLGAVALSLPLIFEPAREFFQSIDLSPYIDPQALNFISASFESFAWSQWTAKNLSQVGTLAAIVFGMGAFSNELSYGTALFLLSKPVTRREIYTTKVVAGILLLAVSVLGSTLLLALVAALKGFDLDYGAFFVANLIAFAGLAVVYLGTVIFSVLIAEAVKAGVAAAFFWLLLSIPGYFAPTAELSIFYQIKAIPYWLNGQSAIVPLGFFLVLAGALYEIGVWLWNRREI